MFCWKCSIHNGKSKKKTPVAKIIFKLDSSIENIINLKEANAVHFKVLVVEKEFIIQKFGLQVKLLDDKETN